MESLFAVIDEKRGEAFRTRSFAEAFARNPSLVRHVAVVAATIKTHFLGRRGWHFRLHEGSLTFQSAQHAHRAIKVFVDLDSELALRAGLIAQRDPVVVGVELTEENPFVRERVRDYLLEMFGDRYLDPRGGRPDSLEIVHNSKYWIVPHGDHFYDIVFMPPPGRIALGADADHVAFYARRLQDMDARPGTVH